MAIPETQLDIWAKQGSVTQSKATYTTLKNALESSDAAYANRAYNTFLQGSYGNDTNIFADSDVDIVMELTSIYYSGLESLSDTERQAFNADFSKAEYEYADFKRDVLSHLTKKYGSDVEPGNKAICVKGNGSRRDADVVVAATYYKYTRYRSAYDHNKIEGICFWSGDGTQVINYPKLHSTNCTDKHHATLMWFKPTVRIFKNMRNAMIDKGFIDEGLAPSYFIEGMLYNVPHNKFGLSYGETVANALNWFRSADQSKLVCANEQYYLCNASSPVTWRAENLTSFLSAAVTFWNSW